MTKTKRIIIFILITILLIITPNIKVMAYNIEGDYKYVVDACFEDAEKISNAKGCTYTVALSSIKEAVLNKNNEFLEDILEPLHMKPDDQFRKELAEIIENEIDAQTFEKNDSTELRSDIKKDMDDEYKNFKSLHKKETNYITLLKNRCKEIEENITTGKIPSGYTAEGLSYLKTLYEDEIEIQEAKKAVKNGTINGIKYEEGLDEEEKQDKIDEIERNIRELEAMPGSYQKNGRSRNQLVKDLQAIKQAYEDEQGKKIEEEAAEKQGNSTAILGQSSVESNHTADEIIDDADDFINAGKSSGSKISQTNLKQASNSLYNLLLVFGIILAVIIGFYLAIKFMLASAEDKAKVKEALVPYVAGCIVIFSGFVIWKIAILLLGGIA